jgi:GNAT superfamily N-acetyltransferase
MGPADVPAVRPAAPDDAAAIASAHVRSWQAAYRGIVPDAVLDALSIDRRASWWRGELTEMAPPTACWVVERSSRVAGFASIGAARGDSAGPGVGELFAIYLEPEAWSQGLGRALMDRAIVGLRTSGFRTAILWVLADNARGRRFYEHAGWQPDGATLNWETAGATLEEVRYRIDFDAQESPGSR